jgi:hypothetical protein
MASQAPPKPFCKPMKQTPSGMSWKSYQYIRRTCWKYFYVHKLNTNNNINPMIHNSNKSKKVILTAINE